MGILGKLAGKAMGVALENTIDYSIGKAYKNGSLNKAYNKYQQVIGQKTEQQLIGMNVDKYKMVIKKQIENAQLVSIDWSKLLYNVYDIYGNLLYVVSGSLTKGQHYFSVYDRFNNQVGEIIKSYMAFKIPFEKAARECEIKVAGQHVASLRTYTSGKDRCFELQFDNVKIENNRFNTEFIIKRKKENLAYLHKTISNFDQIEEHTYVLDYDNKENELGCLMIAIAIDITVE